MRDPQDDIYLKPNLKCRCGSDIELALCLYGATWSEKEGRLKGGNWVLQCNDCYQKLQPSRNLYANA